MELQKMVNLLLISVIFFMTGLSISLPFPFYPTYALTKDISITEIGLVFGSSYFAELFSTPIWAKNTNAIGGTKSVALFSVIFITIGNVVCILLDFTDNYYIFLGVSFSSRMMIGIGQAGVISSGYTLAAQQSSSRHMGKLVSLADSSRCLGEIIGSLFGGLLFLVGGIKMPFLVCSGMCLLIIVLAKVLLKSRNIEYEDIVAEDERNISWCQILSIPSIPASMFSLIFACSAYRWTSSSIQPFLMETFNTTISETSLIIMIISLMYMVATPMIGFLLDLGLNRNISILLGNSISSVSFLLIGPVPQLHLLGSHVWLTAAAHGLNGLGCGITFMGSLISMTESTTDYLPNTVETKVMVSSLWSVCYSIGGILGSTLGGLAYDKVGFEAGTGMEAAALGTSVIIIGLYTGWRKYKN